MTESAPQPHFSDGALEHLNITLRRYLASWEEPRQDQLRAALARLCTEAHAAGMGPERMLVAVKLAWAHVPGIAEMDVDRAQLAFSRIVEHCIEAYYDGTPEPRREW
jgi:hypothetical protein